LTENFMEIYKVRLGALLSLTLLTVIQLSSIPN